MADTSNSPATATQDKTTFSARNPGKAVQQARGRKKGQPLSMTQKLAMKEANKARQIRAEDLAADIEAFCAYRAELMARLASKHDKSIDYIKALLLNETGFKAVREVTLRNAVMHHLKLQGDIGAS
jgi:hypothetical protein